MVRDGSKVSLEMVIFPKVAKKCCRESKRHDTPHSKCSQIFDVLIHSHPHGVVTCPLNLSDQPCLAPYLSLTTDSSSASTQSSIIMRSILSISALALLAATTTNAFTIPVTPRNIRSARQVRQAPTSFLIYLYRQHHPS